LELIKNSKIVIAIHGCKDIQDSSDYGKHIFIGGLHKDLNKLQETLANTTLSISKLPKFSGEHEKNICNRGTEQGIQFELTKSFRDDEELCEKFIEIIQNAYKFKVRN